MRAPVMRVSMALTLVALRTCASPGWTEGTVVGALRLRSTGGSLLVLARLRGFADRFDDAGVGEGGGVAKGAVAGDVAQQAAHDLAGAGFREVGGEHQRFGAGNRADLDADVLAQFLAEVVARLDAAAEDDEGAD